MNRCKTGQELAKEFFKVAREQEEDDHCCNPDECCEGMGDCGLDCCNEDGANGHCFCAEPQRERTKKEDKEWDRTYSELQKHEDNCNQCKEALGRE